MYELSGAAATVWDHLASGASLHETAQQCGVDDDDEILAAVVSMLTNANLVTVNLVTVRDSTPLTAEPEGPGS